MSLEALGNIGEFVGSIAVLISLMYLAIQIKKSTETEQTTTYQSIVSDFGRVNRLLASDSELNFLFMRALEDFDALEPSDKVRMSQVFYVVFRSFENMFYQNRKGYLEQDLWVGWKRLALTYAGRPGFKTWWAARRDLFSAPFARFLEEEELDRPIPSYAEISQLSSFQGPASD